MYYVYYNDAAMTALKTALRGRKIRHNKCTTTCMSVMKVRDPFRQKSDAPEAATTLLLVHSTSLSSYSSQWWQHFDCFRGL
jgi:hypothetical protein